MNLFCRCPFGADLIEIETNMCWKVKKRVLGQYQIRRRFSTVDSCSTFYWDSENSEKRKELYIDSSNPSLNTTEDDLGLSNSREHLVQSINRICEPEKPLIVSISWDYVCYDRTLNIKICVRYVHLLSVVF